MLSLEVISQQPQSNARPTPLLFVHGAWHGAWCWENFLPYFAQHGYQTQAEIFPAMAHDMMLETEWQTVADHILAWLNERAL